MVSDLYAFAIFGKFTFLRIKGDFKNEKPRHYDKLRTVSHYVLSEPLHGKI